MVSFRWSSSRGRGRSRRSPKARATIDREMLSDILDHFEKVLADGTLAQKKDLLRRLVKKVLVHDKRTIEIWYALPNQASVRTPGHLAPRVGLEPTTLRLTAGCSTIELPRSILSSVQEGAARNRCVPNPAPVQAQILATSVPAVKPNRLGCGGPPLGLAAGLTAAPHSLPSPTPRCAASSATLITATSIPACVSMSVSCITHA